MYMNCPITMYCDQYCQHSLHSTKIHHILKVAKHFAVNIVHNGASGVNLQEKQKQNINKNRPIILFYALVHTANSLELMGSFRHAALLFGDTLFSTHSW